MGCKECGKPKCNGECGCKSPKVLQINNPAEYITFHKVSIPAAMGDSTTNPPKIGAYRNALVYYEADHTSWMYSTDGIPTLITGEKGETGPQGPQGIQGPIGPAGADGESFTPVVVSSLPSTGTEGKLYLTPKAHTTQTATGNPITATVAEEAGMIESFQLDGDTYQQTYTGKNLFNKDTVVNGYVDPSNGSIVARDGVITSDYIPVDPSTTYTTTLRSDWAVQGLYDINKAFIERTSGNSLTIPENARFIRICLVDSLKDTFQVEEGSTATSYEPYVGGQPSPNPDYPQIIQTVTGEQAVDVQGKNLFRAKDGQYRDSTLTVDVENGVIHVYGHQHPSFDQNIWIPVEDIRADGTYTLTMNYSGSGGGAFRLTKDKSYQAANNFGGTYYAPNRDTPVTASATNITYNWVLIYLSHGGSQSEVDYYINPQFESGSSSTAFAPYSKQTYEINLGKNLFNRNDVVNGIPANTDGSIVSTSSVGRTSDYIPVTPGTVYSHTGHPLGWANVAWYKADKSFITRNADATTVTSPSEAAYARVSCAQGDLGTCQFEAGNPTSYAPYFEPIELCDIEGQKQPLVFDYIYKDGENWKIHKAIAKQTIIGSEVGLNSNYANVQFATVPKPSDSRMYGNYTAIFIYNDHAIYRYNSGSWNNSDLDHGVFTTPNEKRYWFGYPKGTSLETMQSELNGAITYYALAIPTDTTITDQTLIAQLEAIRTASLQNGANTITNTATGSNLAGDMEVGYYGYNPRNRYDEWLWLDINNEYEQIGS